MIAQAPSGDFPPSNPPIDGWVVYLMDVQPTFVGLNDESNDWAIFALQWPN
jgi:hypothetical protein